MLSRGAVHDPGIGFITLTRVQASPDLQVAHVYYTTMGDERARRETAKALDRATPFLRREIGSRIRLRRVPVLEFRFDESVTHQDRVERILQDLHREDAERAAAATGHGDTTPADTAPAGTGPADTAPADAVPSATNDDPREEP